MAKDIMFFIGGILAFFLVMYIMYWFIKSGSYWLFYEDMVKDTIREMVKPQYLIQLK